MYYSKTNSKEAEQFPNIMNKEDTKELSSIISSLNSTSSQKENIGLNLQYRQVKLPMSIYESLKQRKKNTQKILEEEKKDQNIIDILSLYEDNKSTEEQYKRGKMLENENLDKKIKKLNSEENELLLEAENFKNSANNLNQKLKSINDDKDKICNNIMMNELEQKNNNDKIIELQAKIEIKIRNNENHKNFEKYLEEQKKIQEKQNYIKTKLCYKCKQQPRIYYYSLCNHLVLCRNCYSNNNNNNGNNIICPICSEVSELIIKVNLRKSDTSEYII
jgi:hypothetical protein